MGVISNTVMPVCDQLCFFCPAMRPRSRQPVKRYKKMLANIFPKSPDTEPNERMVSKLCEYASKNPLRIPRITTSLEQRCYRELRNENLSSVKIVMYVYQKLLTSCNQQMPLFAGSFLDIVNVLLDQIKYDEVRIAACLALFHFITNQSDATYVFNLESLIPKLCLIAQEMGTEERILKLRCSGLQVLSSMVWFMGEFGHMPAEFDNVVAVVLENYEGPEDKPDYLNNDNQDTEIDQDRQECAGVNQANASSEAISRATSWKNIVTDRGLSVTLEESTNPKFWSKVCLHNMAKLAKEATTVRRILESLFRYFDNEDLWSPQHGVAISVLLDMQWIVENSGHNAHFLLCTLIKHLDHKNVLKNPDKQVDIVEVATSLALKSKVESSVTIVGAFGDMMRHLRKSQHNSLDQSDLEEDIIEQNKKLRAAVDECLVQMSRKIGDPGPILDMMAEMLESISNATVTARDTIATVHRTAQIVSSLPNLSYQNKAFPEALFHQILLAMVSTDYETRIEAHRLFSVVLVPSSFCPCPSTSAKKGDIQRTLSRAVSVFSVSAALFHKLSKMEHPSQEIMDGKENIFNDENEQMNNQSMLTRLKSSYSRAYSSKRLQLSEIDEGKGMGNVERELDCNSLKLKTQHISLLLSSIWAQAISPMNTPKNYEAIAHTYSLVILFSRIKKSCHDSLIRSFQLAFSLRKISLQGGKLPPSRSRSLFTLSTSMIVFSSKVYNLTRLLASAKAALIDKTVDPFLKLVDECKLQDVTSTLDPMLKVYGSKEDDEDALRSLSALQKSEKKSTESFASMIVDSLKQSLDKDINVIQQQLLKTFIPDDVCPLRAKDLDPIFTSNDSFSTTGAESQTDPNPQILLQEPSLMDVNQLLDLILDATVDAETQSVSNPETAFMDYDSQCVALQMGKQNTMDIMSAEEVQENLLFFFQENTNPFAFDDQNFPTAGNANDNPDPYSVFGVPSMNPTTMSCAAEFYCHFFVPPASSPYDNFLKAVGS
ncbi:PREDICTED: uncharacterized protein LOC109182864 [Ipomoea nil]|uniref:uncharacterized protein LOC109182864 n=1 Tax=Ipomoea nil TaxID=35883 RepID=UPI000901BBCC|nr:PREDICTED: uncharacterized protein LOC109182864 [Ipomoea nil]